MAIFLISFKHRLIKGRISEPQHVTERHCALRSHNLSRSLRLYTRTTATLSTPLVPFLLTGPQALS